MKAVPKELQSKLLEHGAASEDDIIYWMTCDRAVDGSFADTCLLLSMNELWIVTNIQRQSQRKTFRGYVAAKADTVEDAPLEYSKVHVEKIPIDSIDSIFTADLVASGLVVVKTTEERAVAAFTNGYRKESGKLVNAFKKIKKQEEIDREKLWEDGKQEACPQCGMIYPEKERAVCPKCLKKRAIFLRLLSMTTKYKASIFLIVLFMVLNAATGLVIPYLQGTVLFDQALAGTGQFAGKIGLVIFLIILFRTISLLFGIIFGTMNAKMGANVAFDLKAGIFSSLQRLSLQFFQKKQTGQLMTRVNNDAAELQYFFVDGISYFLVNAMNMIGITIILFVMDWKLTLLCFIPLPFVVVFIRWVFPRLYRLSWRRHQRVSIMNSMISDSIRGSRVVKAFGKERMEMQRFQRVSSSYAEVEQSFNKMNSTVFPFISMVTQIGAILIWAFGGWQVMEGTLKFGYIMSFIGYLMMLYGPIQYMNNIAGWWSYCMSAAQRIFEIQDAVPDVAEKDDAIELKHMRGDIRVSDVTFCYEPNKPVLKNVTLHAKPGQMIGVVGSSGAGKSTLVNLVSRLYDVTEGEILLDGINVKDLSADTLRKQIGIVSQEIYVFMGTIAENIAYANPECSMEDIIHAAKIANAHDFIEKLPDGYDTIVGTGGHSLSGGEKQRISIARAVLHNPKILILDEATASLDTETELQIQEALESLMKGRTTIAIAHRLSTLRNADYLVVMENGKVAESGTHDELLALEGIYFGMVKKHDDALKMREAV